MGNFLKNCDDSKKRQNHTVGSTKSFTKSNNLLMDVDEVNDVDDVNDSDITIETIYTIRISLHVHVAEFLMCSLYNRLRVDPDRIKILIEGIDFTIFVIDNKQLHDKLLVELNKSEIKYT